MLRFVALLEDRPGGDGVARRELARIYAGQSDWRSVLVAPGVDVFVAAGADGAADVRVLADAGGVVLGALFGMTPGVRASERIRASGGRSLLEHAWGSYVALWSEEAVCAPGAEGGAHMRWQVLRDPSGQMPLYRWHTPGCEILFSDFADVAHLARVLGAPSVDWRFIGPFLKDSELRTHETGLVGVSEILAGERLTFTAGGAETTLLWDAGEICRRGWLDDAPRAQAELRATTQAVIETWGRRASLILHHLSGGFDSAVVLGCAVRAGLASAITPVNRFTLRSGEDERHYARVAAWRAGVRLIECPWTSDVAALQCLRAAPRMPRPSVEMLALIEQATIDALARQCCASVQWTGQGGDHLFFQMRTDLGAADVLRTHGIGTRWLSAIADGARLTRRSYWAVLGSAIENGWRDRSDLPAGKRYQMAVIARLVNRPDPLRTRRAVPELHPLISQPLMELVLRLPTDLLLRGGRTRALARAAFRDCVPEVIGAREDKGGTTVHLAMLLRENSSFLREVLLEGRLVREGLTERPWLERYLLEGHPLRVGELSFLLAALSSELWLEQVA